MVSIYYVMVALTVDEFEELLPAGGTVRHDALAFLRTESDKAFKLDEIRIGIKLPVAHVRDLTKHLTNLVDDSLVAHRVTKNGVSYYRYITG